MPINPPNSAVFTLTIQKGADLIIAYVPMFSVSPNTDIKRTEDNNHPTPNIYMTTWRNLNPVYQHIQYSKRGIFH